MLYEVITSGDNLYKRGIKQHGGRAPLRETLAAAALMLAGFDPDEPLIDVITSYSIHYTKLYDSLSSFVQNTDPEGAAGGSNSGSGTA